MTRCNICKQIFEYDMEFERHECSGLVRIPQTVDNEIVAPQDCWKYSLICIVLLLITTVRSLSPGPVHQRIVQMVLMTALSSLGFVFSVKGVLFKSELWQKTICLFCLLPGAILFTLFFLACMRKIGIL